MSLNSIFLFGSLIFLVLGKIPSCNPPDNKPQPLPTKTNTVITDNDVKVYENFGLTLPAGFKIDIVAENIVNARAMCLGDKGTLFVGSRREGAVYALVDNNNDYKFDKVITLAKDLDLPVGVAFKDDDLYASALNKIVKFEDIENNLENVPDYKVVSNAFPDDRSHGWKFIAFGPDDKLYVPVGAPCNICEEDPLKYSNIMRMNADGSELETFAQGVRNTVGFDWHPTTNELWFTDNGRDNMGDDLPPCELNHAPKANMHFGFPYCHGSNVADPKFGDKRDCSEFEPPKVEFVAHTAPLGMRFYTGEMFPKKYKNGVFVAQHGSWNRSTKSGYKVMFVEMNDQQEIIETTEFIAGFEKDNDVTGRPVDVQQLPDGSLLLSDDYGHKIYRITYEP